MSLQIPLKMPSSLAESIIQRSLSDDVPLLPIGPLWAKRFMDKYYLKKIKQKPIEPHRKEAHDPAIIRAWFASFKGTLAKYSIKASNLWNFDETGFWIGIGGGEWVTIMDTKRRAWSPSDTSRIASQGFTLASHLRRPYGVSYCGGARLAFHCTRG